MSLSSLGVGMMHLLAKLPLPLLRALGKYVGRLLFVLAGQRRRVALRNLELCFPEMGESERRTLAKQTFEAFCQTFLDRSWLWFGSEALVRSRVRLEGAIDELEGDTPTIVFAPHFYSMDAGAGAAAQHRARIHLDLCDQPRSGAGRMVHAGAPALWPCTHA